MKRLLIPLIVMLTPTYAADAPVKKALIYQTAKSANTNILATNLQPTAANVVTYKVTIAPVSTAVTVSVYMTDGTTTSTYALDAATTDNKVVADKLSVVTFDADTTMTYNLQVDADITVGYLLVQEYRSGQSIAGRSGGGSGGGSGDLTAVTATGVGILVASGTGPVPDLSLHADLEGLADDTGTAGTVAIGGSPATWSASPLTTSYKLGAATTAGVLQKVSATTDGAGYLAVREGDDSAWNGIECNSIRLRDSGGDTEMVLHQNSTIYLNSAGNLIWGTAADLDGSTTYDGLLARTGSKAFTWDDSAGGNITVTLKGTLTLPSGLAATSGGTGQTTWTQGDILFASAANTLAKLGAGTALQQLRMNAGATAPEWADSAPALSHVELDMRDGYAYPSTTSSATLNTRNGHFVLDFEASETSANAALFDDSILFQFTMPEDYAGGDITVSLTVAALTATTGNMMFYMSWEAEPISYDLDADSFDSVVTFTTTATSGTDGATVRISSTFTPAQLDDVAAGDTVRMLLCRDNNAALDTLAVKAQLVAVTITEEP